MMKKLLLFLLLGAFVVLTGQSVLAGTGIISIDTIQGALSGTTIDCRTTARVILRFNNNGTDGAGEKCNVSNGWRVTTSDGAVWDSVVLDSAGPLNADLENVFLLKFDVTGSVLGGKVRGNGSPADTVGFLGAGSPGVAKRQIPITYDDTCMAFIIYFGSSNAIANNNKHICIDSAFFPPGGAWKWVGASLVVYKPVWAGLEGATYISGLGNCFTLKNPDVSAPENGGNNLPTEFSLSQNFPNPFNPGTKIKYAVPTRSYVRLTIFNVLGQKVRTLVDEEKVAGSYDQEWDGKSENGTQVTSGIYFYKIEAGNYIQTKKMVLMK